MKKISLYFGIFLVSSIFASWTNKVSDRLLNPQKYFKKQKLRIYRNSIPVQTNESGICMWSGCKTDKGAYFETELECIVYNINEGKIILLTDNEYSNILESPYKGFYRFYRFSRNANTNNFLNNLSLYADQSFINSSTKYFSGLNSNEKVDHLKYRKSWTPLSIKIVVKRKDNKIVYIYNSNVKVDGVVLSDKNPLAYRCLIASFKKDDNKWLATKGLSGTFFSNLSRYFAHNEDATKLIVK